MATPISHPELNGLHWYDQFRARGGAAGATEAADFGITRYVDTDGVAPPLYMLRELPVEQDNVLVQAIEYDGVLGDWVAQAGATWKLFRPGLAGLAGAVRVVGRVRELAAPGAPMKHPTGHTIRIGGNTVPQPASGEPARDQWTGALTGGTQP